MRERRSTMRPSISRVRFFNMGTSAEDVVVARTPSRSGVLLKSCDAGDRLAGAGAWRFAFLVAIVPWGHRGVKLPSALVLDWLRGLPLIYFFALGAFSRPGGSLQTSMPTNKQTSRRRRGGSGRPSAFSTFTRVLIGLGAVLAIVVGLFVWGLYYYFTYDLPNLTSLKDYARTVPLITTVYAGDGTVIGEFYKERRRYVPVEQMPRMLVNAFVAAEDQRFFQHPGLDYLGIVRAFVENLKAADTLQGGSTLTQQVARTFFLSREKSFIRKIKEAILATRMEHFLSKDEILNLYMNHIYLGHGAYGVEAAAENYFGKRVTQLNLAEMALIAAMPKAPSPLNPFPN